MPRTQFVLVVICLACLTTAVAADLLKTHAGETIETRGPWRVKGKQVIFTNEKGVLSSLRLADIDIEASEEVDAKGFRTGPAKQREAART